MQFRLVSAAAMAIAAFLTAPAASFGAITIGDATGSPKDAAAGIQTFVPQNYPGGPSFVVPAGGGVITGFSASVDTTSPTTFTFSVMRPTAPGNYKVIAKADMAATATTSGDRIRSVGGLRIPVLAGDTLGVGVGAVGAVLVKTATASDLTDYSLGLPPAVGGTWTKTGTDSGVRLMIAATMEPDADADGYGDETQDACPGDAALQTAPCSDLTASITPAVSSVPLGGVATLTVTVQQRRGSKADASTLAIDVPPGLQVLAAVGAGGTCSVAGGAVACPVPAIPGSGSAVVQVVVRGVAAGAQAVKATASAGTTDIDPTNDASTATVDVAATGPTSTAPTATASYCRVPALKGLTVSAATAKLKAAGCAAGTLKRPKGKARGRKTVVAAQSVQAGLDVKPGNKVGITLAYRKR